MSIESSFVNSSPMANIRPDQAQHAQGELLPIHIVDEREHLDCIVIADD